MSIKYNNQFLSKLEDIFAQSDYILRYEKGRFTSGYCVLKDTKVVIVNKYFPLEGKINCLIDVLKTLEIDLSGLNEKSKKFYQEMQLPQQSQLNL